jgi:hypothetical protein
MRGGGRAPPMCSGAPSPARTDFTLITECTPESSGFNSVYSVVYPFLDAGKIRENLHFLGGYRNNFQDNTSGFLKSSLESWAGIRKPE